MPDQFAQESDLLVDVTSAVGTLTLNRPEVLNPLSAAHLRQLSAAIYSLGQRDDVRVIVLTGAGRAFSAGGDLRILTRDVVVDAAHWMIETLSVMRTCPKPIIAKVNGDAVGGGNELVIGCDLAVAASSARLGHAGTRLGWAPIAGGTNFLSMSVGDKRSREITFLSKVVTAETAHEWGWINEVVDPSRLDEATARWCQELVERSPRGLRLAKASANFWWDLAYPSMTSGLALLDSILTGESVSEGVAAFMERRPPVW